MTQGEGLGLPGAAVPDRDLAPTVVLVDDSLEVRAIVRRHLESSGFDVVAEGGDGDDAILLAYRHEPDLLLLDISMPQVDGIEALPAILALSPMTKVAIFTGFEEPALASRARELGAAEFIEKSLPLEELPSRLRRTLAEPTLEPARGRPESSEVFPAPGGPGNRSSPGRGDDRDEQATLSAHVQQFQELFDRAEIGMATLTSNGTVVRANRAIAGLMSCRGDDLVGVDYGRLSVGKGDEFDRRLEDVVTLGQDSASFEHPLPVPKGEEPSRIVRATLAPIRDSGGHVLYVFAQVQDVTSQRAVESDLRRSEESFRRLVTAVGEYAIFMLDVEGTVVSWNYGAQRIKGYTATEIIGEHFRAFYPLEDQAEGHPEYNLELALREGSYAGEGWRIRKDGSRFWASVVITSVYDDDGELVGFAKVTHDQTQQREHDQERQRFIDQRIHLLALTAHELRGPIAVIDGSAAALGPSGAETSDAEHDKLLRSIRGSVNRLRRLAADLTQASRSEGEMLQMQIRELSLAEALQSAAARSQAAGVVVSVELDSPRGAVFQADPERLAQALDNLLDNAVRHGAPPFRLISSVNDVVSIRVIDSGPGVPPELEPHLFERFAKTGLSGGTGLGLYLVQEIARRHGGAVVYHPPAGEELTAFELRLPIPH
jgi:PAS domain S-box-containing protein